MDRKAEHLPLCSALTVMTSLAKGRGDGIRRLHQLFAQDEASADAACATLEQAGIRCWIGRATSFRGLIGASSIVTAITGAKVLVLIFSQHANDRRRSSAKSSGRSPRACRSFRCG